MSIYRSSSLPRNSSAQESNASAAVQQPVPNSSNQDFDFGPIPSSAGNPIPPTQRTEASQDLKSDTSDQADPVASVNGGIGSVAQSANSTGEHESLQGQGEDAIVQVPPRPQIPADQELSFFENPYSLIWLLAFVPLFLLVLAWQIVKREGEVIDRQTEPSFRPSFEFTSNPVVNRESFQKSLDEFSADVEGAQVEPLKFPDSRLHWRLLKLSRSSFPCCAK